MKFAPLAHSRRLLLLLVLSFTLLGVQLVQDSALHNHQHAVDCALCHVHLSDDSEHSPSLTLAVSARPPFQPAAVILAVSVERSSPYQSRAPPAV